MQISLSRKGTMEALRQQEMEFPLVGRSFEMDIFTRELHKIQNDPNQGSQLQVIVVQGDSGVGKSRLLDSMVVKAMEEGIK